MSCYVFYYGYKIERFNIDKTLCVFKNAKQVVKEYDRELEVEQINNMIPYANPYAFENQMLRDLTSQDPMHVIGQNDRDEYGYQRNQYAGIAKKSELDQQVSVSDLSFFYDVNQIF
jgi:hypothetical protein